MAILRNNSQIAGITLSADGNSAGLVVNKVSNTEMGQISSPTKGAIIFNTTDNQFYRYTGNAWTSQQGGQGAIGVQGATGPQGNQGPQGPQGNQGPQGIQGAQGVQGNTGPTNNIQGAKGPQGSKGPTGNTGPDGARGTRAGAQGPQGNQGPQGPQGVQGAKGPAGYQGYMGAKGPQGARGPRDGAKGPAGPQGYQGSVGATNNQAGAQGAQGPGGSQGAKGAQGYQGAPGWPYQAASTTNSPQFAHMSVAHAQTSTAFRLWVDADYAVHHSQVYAPNNYGLNGRGNTNCAFFTNLQGTTKASLFSGGNVYMAGNRASDERLKVQIQQYTGSAGKDGNISGSMVERLSTLKPKKFRFVGQDDNRRKQVGLIAQDVRLSFPELIDADNDGTGSAGAEDYMAVNYVGLNAVLLEAVREIKDTLTSFENRVTTLEG